MAQEKAPAFQFYPKDFLTDERVRLMSHTERGLYITLLCYCWLEQSLPSDVSQLARLMAVPCARFERLWSGPLAECFRKGDDGRLYHKRLEEERTKQEAFRRRASDGGKSALDRRGASGRFATRVAGANDQQQTETKHQGSTRSSISDLQSAVSDLQKKSSGGSKRPIYTSDRFAVFEWQLDELGRMLGSHLDDFNLHEFFDKLTQDSRSAGLVIPKDELWKWLQSQVVSEARRRGLPMATADVSAPTNKRIAGLVAGGQAFLNRGSR